MDTVTLTLAADEPVSLLQITDTHLFAQPDGQLLGIRTAESFQAVLDACARGEIDGRVVLLIYNRRDAYARVRAEQAGIPANSTLYFVVDIVSAK